MRAARARRGVAPVLAIVIALVVGLVVGVLAGRFGVSDPNGDLPPAGDRLGAVIEGLRDDPFYVAPEVADRLTDDQQRAISEALADAEAPSYVIYAAGTTDAGYYLESRALEVVMAGVGDGRYVWVDDVLQTTTEARGMAETDVDTDLLRARPAEGLLAYATAMAAEPQEPESTFDYYGGRGGGIAAGAITAFGGFLALLLLVALAGWLRPGSPRRKATPT